MLRKIIKSFIPNRGEIFFDLFIQGVKNIHSCTSILGDMINGQRFRSRRMLVEQLQHKQKKAINIDKNIISELDKQLLTPIDRGDIFSLSKIILRFVRQIIKINKKIEIYNIDKNTNNCLTDSVLSLQNITTTLCDLLTALKSNDEKKLQIAAEYIAELDKNIIEELEAVIDTEKQTENNFLLMMKIKEVFKLVEGVVTASAVLCDFVMRIHIKEI